MPLPQGSLGRARLWVCSVRARLPRRSWNQQSCGRTKVGGAGDLLAHRLPRSAGSQSRRPAARDAIATDRGPPRAGHDLRHARGPAGAQARDHEGSRARCRRAPGSWSRAPRAPGCGAAVAARWISRAPRAARPRRRRRRGGEPRRGPRRRRRRARGRAAARGGAGRGAGAGSGALGRGRGRDRRRGRRVRRGRLGDARARQGRGCARFESAAPRAI
jgi:hypothetical protein